MVEVIRWPTADRITRLAFRRLDGVKMTRAQWQAIVDHARAEAPLECCGYGHGRDGRVLEVVPAVNERRSPYAFELGFEALRAANDLDDQGYDVLVYHSHPRSEPRPSQQDINVAMYPDWRYVIVSLADPDAPEVRAWRIADGKVEEEEIEVA